MKKVLKTEDNACSSYQQSNNICNKCIRNIGFFSSTHKNWKEYKLIGSNCDGYIERKSIYNL